MTKDEWEKTESEVFKFEREGDAIEGVLIAKERGMQFDNEVYKIKTSNGRVYAVFGTAMLSGQMGIRSIGDSVKIVFTGTKASKTPGHSPIKLFDVYFKK